MTPPLRGAPGASNSSRPRIVLGRCRESTKAEKAELAGRFPPSAAAAVLTGCSIGTSSDSTPRSMSILRARLKICRRSTPLVAATRPEFNQRQTTGQDRRKANRPPGTRTSRLELTCSKRPRHPLPLQSYYQANSAPPRGPQPVPADPHSHSRSHKATAKDPHQIKHTQER